MKHDDVSGEVMAVEKTVELRVGKAGSEVRTTAFLKAARIFLDLLREVESSFTKGEKTSLDWFISDLRPGSALMALDAPSEKPLGYSKDDVAKATVEGVRELHRSATRPARFNDRALGKVLDLTTMLRRETNGIKLAAREVDCEVESEVAANIAALLDVPFQEWGTVDGVLKMISLAGPARFSVYDVVTGRAVTCHFEDEHLDQVTNALGKRVSVYGLLGYSADGHLRTARDIISIDVYPTDDQLPTTDEMLSLNLDLTGGLTFEEFMRQKKHEH